MLCVSFVMLCGSVVTGVGGDYIPKQVLPSPRVQTISQPAYSQETLQSVARIVMAETRGEPIENMRGVAQCIFDRHILWDKGVNEILNAPSQFAPPYMGTVTEECQTVVNEVFLQGVKEFDSNVTHFYNPEKCDPYWADTKTVVGSRGKHRFLY